MSSNSEKQGDDGATKPRKKRPDKPLPPELDALTFRDYDKFTLAIDKDTKLKDGKEGDEVICVISVTIPQGKGSDPKVFYIKDLTADHHKKLASRLGIKGCSTVPVFEMRHIMGRTIKYTLEAQKGGINVVPDATRLSNTLFRITNVVFSSALYSQFLQVNDLKKRKDHEAGTTYKKFWIKCADTHNTFGDDDEELDGLIFPESEREQQHLTELTSDINPKAVMNLTADFFKTKVASLFKVRRTMQENMTVSGTHESNPLKFVDIAIKTASENGVTGMTRAACYYFFLRCEEHKEVDESFQPFLDECLKGSTETDWKKESKTKESAASADKKRASSSIEEMSRTSAEMLEAFKKQTKDNELTSAAIIKVNETHAKLNEAKLARLVEQKTLDEKERYDSARERALKTYIQVGNAVDNPHISKRRKTILTAEIKRLEKEWGFGCDDGAGDDDDDEGSKEDLYS